MKIVFTKNNICFEISRVYENSFNEYKIWKFDIELKNADDIYDAAEAAKDNGSCDINLLDDDGNIKRKISNYVFKSAGREYVDNGMVPPYEKSVIILNLVD